MVLDRFIPKIDVSLPCEFSLDKAILDRNMISKSDLDHLLRPGFNKKGLYALYEVYRWLPYEEFAPYISSIWEVEVFKGLLGFRCICSMICHFEVEMNRYGHLTAVLSAIREIYEFQVKRWPRFDSLAPFEIYWWEIFNQFLEVQSPDSILSFIDSSLNDLIRSEMIKDVVWVVELACKREFSQTLYANFLNQYWSSIAYQKRTMKIILNRCSEYPDEYMLDMLLFESGLWENI